MSDAVAWLMAFFVWSGAMFFAGWGVGLARHERILRRLLEREGEERKRTEET